MNKYTAEDFANAEFARHPDGRIAARLYPGLKEQWAMFESAWGSSDHRLAIDDWVPVPDQAPGRTITESEFHETADAHRNGGIGWQELSDGLGITVVPDPEPTNAEKLANVYREWYGGDEVPTSLIRFMDQAGVTAPEEK